MGDGSLCTMALQKQAGGTGRSTTLETDSLGADSLIHLDLRGLYIRRHSLNSWCIRSPNKALEKNELYIYDTPLDIDLRFP